MKNVNLSNKKTQLEEKMMKYKKNMEEVKNKLEIDIPTISEGKDKIIRDYREKYEMSEKKYESLNKDMQKVNIF